MEIASPVSSAIYVYTFHNFISLKITLFSRWSKTSIWKISCQTYRESSGGALYVFWCTCYISCSWIKLHIIGNRRHSDIQSANLCWMPAVCLVLPSPHISHPSICKDATWAWPHPLAPFVVLLWSWPPLRKGPCILLLHISLCRVPG